MGKIDYSETLDVAGPPYYCALRGAWVLSQGRDYSLMPSGLKKRRIHQPYVSKKAAQKARKEINHHDPSKDMRNE